ncbi:MAG: hypothetical protein ACK496_16765 [Acidobacteriota bacterium]
MVEHDQIDQSVAVEIAEAGSGSPLREQFASARAEPAPGEMRLFPLPLDFDRLRWSKLWRAARSNVAQPLDPAKD